jgi:hypothetical protein
VLGLHLVCMLYARLCLATKLAVVAGWFLQFARVEWQLSKKAVGELLRRLRSAVYLCWQGAGHIQAALAALSSVCLCVTCMCYCILQHQSVDTCLVELVPVIHMHMHVFMQHVDSWLCVVICIAVVRIAVYSWYLMCMPVQSWPREAVCCSATLCLQQAQHNYHI